jgi:ComF family protein
MLVPVPMHPERLRARGYNQAALLARALGRLWRRPVAYRWLRRQRLQVRQVGLGKAERAENVRGAFAATRVGLEGCRVLLVDDVVTTGSTLRNCATTLSDAGALVVGAVALARAERAPLVPAQPRAEEAFLGLGQ